MADDRKEDVDTKAVIVSLADTKNASLHASMDFLLPSKQEVERDDATSFVELSGTDWQTVLVWIFLVVVNALQLAGVAAYIYKRILIDPAQWENPSYALNHAYIYYHIHFASFLAWMYIIGPIILMFKFQTRWMSIYWVTWFIAAILTVIPLFPVQQTKQIFGTGTFIASGVLANAIQVLGGIALFFPSSADTPATSGWFSRFLQRRNLRTEYLAFHTFAGYNLAVFPWKYELMVAKSQNIVTAVIFILLVIYIAGSAFMIYGWKTGARKAPQKRRLTPQGDFASEFKSYGPAWITVNVLLLVAFVVPILTYFAMRTK